MINNLCILFSLAMVVYVAVRASVLDAKRPWFQTATAAEASDSTPGDAHRPAQTRPAQTRR